VKQSDHAPPADRSAGAGQFTWRSKGDAARRQPYRRRFFAERRWPSERPMLNAFCRKAPAVRFMDFTTVFIGDLFLE
jgi:hypothetical protein